ncbi:MAG TPA: peptidoglycan-binding domain-containing protein [Terriglobales bacterium]|nr:peptidoglycan-binding domain-containing protein [Terriglobales bacterium]
MKALKTIGLLICFAVAVSALGAAKVTPKKHSSKVSAQKSSVKGKKAKSVKAKSKKGAWKRRGQQSIASERTLQIQEALASAGYLKSEPTGTMDAATKQALVRLQKENGWQTKVVPDSRALIKLGLGPDHSNILNPDTAVLPTTSATAAVRTAEPQ